MIGTVVLSDAHVSIASAEGPIDIVLSGTISVSKSTIDGRDLTARLTTARTGALDLKIGQLSLAIVSGLSFKGADVTDPKLAVAIRSAEGSVAWRMGGASATLTTGEIVDLASSARFSPTMFSGTVMLEASRLGISVAGRIGGALLVEVNGSYDMVQARGEAAVSAGPIAFRRNGLQPTALLPADSTLGDFEPSAESTLGGIGLLKALRPHTGIEFLDAPL